MEGYSSSGGAGATSSNNGYPQPAMRTSHNRSFNATDSSYATTNGMVSRPVAASSGNVPVTVSRQDSRQSVTGSGGSGGVLMVREASRPTVSMSERSPFASSGNRFQDESGSGGGNGERSYHSSSEMEKVASFALPKILKIAIVGDSTAGKTAICNAFTSEGYNFSRNYHMTTGVSVFSKSVKLPFSRPSAPPKDSLDLEPRINLVLVDSAGKPIYRELLPQYWDRLDGLALVIDLTSNTALETASEWLNLAKGCIASSASNSNENPSRPGHGNHNHPPSDGSGDSSKMIGDQPFLGVLIGSKSDMKDQRMISPKTAEDFAMRHGLQYFECSAKENSGIEEPFFYLVHQWTTRAPKTTDGPGGEDPEKENLEDDLSFSSASGGVRIAAGGGRNSGIGGGGTSTPGTSSRKSAFQSRQNSSDAF